MDKTQWQAHICNTRDLRWKRFYDACEAIEKGSRTAWGMNLMTAFLGHLHGTAGMGVRASAEAVLSDLPRPLQRRGLRMLRVMLLTAPDLSEVLEAMPLHLRREPADVLHRVPSRNAMGVRAIETL